MSKAPAPAEAARIILSRVTLLPAVQSSLRELPGRILRQDVQAERDNPPFDRVCMDGVAIDSRAFASGIRRFRIQATQAAGAVPLTIAGLDSAVEIMTGAVLPHGADCVIPLEEYDLDGDGLQLMGHGFIKVVAAVETLLEARAKDTKHLARLAWHVGNRHTAAEMVGDNALRLVDDAVLRAMLKGLGAELTTVQAPFHPEGGAYAFEAIVQRREFQKVQAVIAASRMTRCWTD